MEQASFHFTARRAKLSKISATLGLLLGALVVIGGVIAAALDRNLFTAAGGLLVSAVGTWLLLKVAQFLRYPHVLREAYLVEPTGIEVRREGETEFVPWHSFQEAEYLPLYLMYRFRKDRSSKPIVLFLAEPGRYSIDLPAIKATAVARPRVQTGIGDRLKRTWLW